MSKPQKHVCTKCGGQFRDAFNLRRHQARKMPCDPIVDPPADKKVGQPCCKYCGRLFTTPTAMYRHVRDRCKIANSDEGMEKLMEHTLQRQLADQYKEMTKMTTLMAEMTTLMKQQLTLAPQPAAARAEPPPRTTTNNTTTNNTQTINTVNNVQIIVPWDGERRINVDVAQIAAAFTENARLKEYTRMADHELTDPEIAPPYVTALLMDLTKRAHVDPTARNVYLNPKRADQALVHMASGRWEVMPLQDATRLMFDGVAQAMVRVTMSHEERKKLPLEAQNALAMAGLLYDDEPDEYARRARAPMVAHLANTAPTAVLTV